MMKTMNTYRKQCGFLAVGAGIALFIVYGALGLAVKSFDPDDTRTLSTQQTDSSVIASHKDE